MEVQDGEEVWKLTGAKCSIAEVWKVIRTRKEKAEWHRLIWSSLTIPKHSVIAWMAILNRLTTLDRLLSWGIDTRGECYLCNEEIETRDHVFLGCHYSKEIWGMILSHCGISRVIGRWEEELKWVISCTKVKKLTSAILIVAWRAQIYYLWRERNGRKHGQSGRSPVQIFEQILDDVRTRLAGLRKFNATYVNRQLCNR